MTISPVSSIVCNRKFSAAILSLGHEILLGSVRERAGSHRQEEVNKKS